MPTMYNPAPYRDAEGHASRENRVSDSPRSSMDSTSTTSLILERLNRDGDGDDGSVAPDHREKEDEGMDLEASTLRLKPAEKKVKRAIYILGAIMVGSWVLALVIYVSREHYRFTETPHDPAATATKKAGKTITLDQVMGGSWRSSRHEIQWIDGSTGTEDGLLLTKSPPESSNFLEVQDVTNSSNTIVLMQGRNLQGLGRPVIASKVWPSPDLKRVLVASNVQTVYSLTLKSYSWIILLTYLELAPLLHC